MNFLRRIVLAALSGMLVAGCVSSADRTSDPICDELRHFARMDTGDSHRSIVLRGGWGGDVPGLLMTHDCVPDGDERANNFCSYLVGNTSWELGRITVNRVAACLDDESAAEHLSAAAEAHVPVQVISSTVWIDGTSSSLTFKYSPTSRNSGLYRLQIVADPRDTP